MNVFGLILLFVLSAATAAPLGPKSDAEIITYQNDNQGDGNYHFEFKTSDGTSRDETGEQKNFPNGEKVIVVRGSYSYIDSSGNMVEVQYTADENGYIPKILSSSNGSPGTSRTSPPPLNHVLITPESLPVGLTASLVGR